MTAVLSIITCMPPAQMLKQAALLQLAGRILHWPKITPKAKHALPGQSKAKWAWLGRSSGLTVFKFTRQADNEFVCEFAPQLMTNMHALGISVSSIARNSAWHWL